MKESTFYQRVRKMILAEFPSARIDRVENGLVDGMPDVNCCLSGPEVWLELKYVEDWPARATTQVLGRKGLRLEQVNWHIRQSAAGGKSWILVGIGKETWIIDNLYARDVNTWTKEMWQKEGMPFSEFLKLSQVF
jgi:hypothetical protein